LISQSRGLGDVYKRQGEFAELLRMKPLERFTALGPLLGNSFYKQLQDDLEREGAKARALRSSAEIAVSNAIQQIKGALGELAEEEGLSEAVALLDVEQSTGATIREAVEAIEQWLTKRNKELKASLNSAKKHEAQTQVHAERANEYQTAVSAIQGATQARARALALLNVSESEFTREQAQEQIGLLIQLLTRLEPIGEREANRDATDVQLQALKTELNDQHEHLAQLTQLAATAPKERARLEQAISAFEILSATMPQRESDVGALQIKAKNFQQLQAAENDVLKLALKSERAVSLVTSTELALLTALSLIHI
jgi:DNA repair exonuclease SbcCD ATPase subunit